MDNECGITPAIAVLFTLAIVIVLMLAIVIVNESMVTPEKTQEREWVENNVGTVINKGYSTRELTAIYTKCSDGVVCYSTPHDGAWCTRDCDLVEKYCPTYDGKCECPDCYYHKPR